MDDLRIPPGPGAPNGLVVSTAELTEQFSRSSGPGGQGVNTTDSRVQLSLDIAVSDAFDDAQRARLLRVLATRLHGTVLSVDASEQRSQRQNRAAARERLAEMIRAALVPAQPRRATKPTKGSQPRRLAAKQQRSQVKRNRARPGTDRD